MEKQQQQKNQVWSGTVTVHTPNKMGCSEGFPTMTLLWGYSALDGMQWQSRACDLPTDDEASGGWSNLGLYARKCRIKASLGV